MTLRTDQLTRLRNEIEQQHLIIMGLGVIVYDVGASAWAIPGGNHTTHRPAAERAAKLIDLMIRGQITGPRILK